MNKNFEWNNEEHTYQIVKESLVDVAKHNIDKIAEVANIVIQNDDDLKRVRKLRTEINNAIKEVADARKQMTAVVLSTFAPMCKDIEQYGAKVAQQLTENINNYVAEKSGEEAKPKAFKLTITSKDKKAIEKVKAYAIKYGCEIKED